MPSRALVITDGLFQRAHDDLIHIFGSQCSQIDINKLNLLVKIPLQSVNSTYGHFALNPAKQILAKTALIDKKGS